MTYTGNTYTTVLDGNNIGEVTAAMESSDQQNTNNFGDSVTLWGYSENVGPYLNLPHGDTTVDSVWFEASTSGGNNYVTGANPYPGDSATYDWVSNLIGIGLVAYPFDTLYTVAGAAVSLLANYTGSVPGISTTTGGPDATSWGILWDGVSRELDMTTAHPYTDDVNYEGYSQQFGLNGNAGVTAYNKGYVEYQTVYYYTDPNLIQYSYDDSATMTITYSLP